MRSWGWGARRLMMVWACIFYPPPALGIPGQLLPTQSKRALFGVGTMTGNTKGSGPLLAPKGSGSSCESPSPSCTRVPQVSCPLARALQSTHCFRIPPPSLSPRISAPHPTAPNRLPRLLRWGSPHTRPGPPSLSRLGGAQRHWD